MFQVPARHGHCLDTPTYGLLYFRELKTRKDRFSCTRGGTTYNGLYGESPPERGTIFRFQLYEKTGIPLVEVFKKSVRKSVILVSKKI